MLPHGGNTHDQNLEGNDSHSVVHAHLDSVFHRRVGGDFTFERPVAEDVYFPNEHLAFEKKDLVLPLLQGKQATADMIMVLPLMERAADNEEVKLTD